MLKSFASVVRLRFIRLKMFFMLYIFIDVSLAFWLVLQKSLLFTFCNVPFLVASSLTLPPCLATTFNCAYRISVWSLV